MKFILARRDGRRMSVAANHLLNADHPFNANMHAIGASIASASTMRDVMPGFAQMMAAAEAA
jgi:hypothetical protein